MSERLLAADLARALDGAGDAAPEAVSLARLLRDAADAARFDVDEQRAEAALARARRSPKPRRSLRPVLALAAAVLVAAVALVLVPEWRSSDIDVEARARGAIAGGPVLHVVTALTTPGGGAADGGSVAWLDPGRDRARLTLSGASGTPRVEILALPGRYVRYQTMTGTAVAAPGCDALASGCAELTDPLSLYRDALLRGGVDEAQRVELEGEPAYRFTLSLRGAGSAVEQVVTVDAESFLPRRIVWRDRSGVVAVVEVFVAAALERSEVPPETFTLSMPPDTRVRQVTQSGDSVRLLEQRRSSIGELRRLGVAAAWLGRSGFGGDLAGVTLFRFNTGDAVRLRYGLVTVWSYSQAVPPALRAGALAPTKVLSEAGSDVHLYELAGGGVAAERDLPEVTVAVVAPAFEKLDLVAVLAQIRPIAPAR